MDKKEELSFVAPLKTLAMLCVVGIHSTVIWSTDTWFCAPANPSAALGVLSSWLGTVAVPVFMMCSGYLYAYLKMETNRYDDMGRVLAKKAKRLLIPYLCACLLWVVPWWVYFNGPDRVIEKYVLASSPSQLWFLVALFDIFVVLEFLWKPLWSKCLRSHWVCGLLVSLLLYGLSPVVGKVFSSAFQVSNAFMYMPFFYIGCVFRRMRTDVFWRVPPPLVWAVGLLLFSAYVNLDAGGAGKVANFIMWVPVRVANAVALVVSLAAFRKRRTCESPGKVAASLSSCCFGIYLFHQQIIQVMLTVINVPFVPPCLIALCCFVVSVAISWALTSVLRRWGPTRAMVGG